MTPRERLRSTEDEAISLITIGVDFRITQVVDGNWGVAAVADDRGMSQRRARLT
jgi:hypothetical protein